MTTPVRLQLSRRKGFDLQAFSRAINGLPAINCARPGRWGNPFRVERHALYGWCAQGRGQFQLARDREDALGKVLDAHRDSMRFRDLSELSGHNLACWCALSARCHVDNYFKLACSA